MTVLLLRHVHAGDRSAWTGDDRRRPASDRGLAEAAALPDLLGADRLVAVWSSPYTRCLDSVAPLAAAAGLDVEEVDELAEGTPPDLAGRLLRRAATLAADRGGAVVCCSHGDVIGDAVTGLVHRGVVAEADARWPKGSCWALDGLLDTRPTARYLPPPR